MLFAVNLQEGPTAPAITYMASKVVKEVTLSAGIQILIRYLYSAVLAIALLSSLSSHSQQKIQLGVTI